MKNQMQAVNITRSIAIPVHCPMQAESIVIIHTSLTKIAATLTKHCAEFVNTSLQTKSIAAEKQPV